MNGNKIALKCKELMLNENWSLRRCCRKYGVSRDWLRKELNKLEDAEFNKFLMTNDVEEIIPKEPAQMALEDFDISFDEEDKTKNFKSPKYLFDKNKNKPINPLAVKMYRKTHLMTQSHLAKMLGVDTSVISRIENGKEERISNNIYDRLLNAVCMDIDTFNKFAERADTPKPVEKPKPKPVEQPKKVEAETKEPNYKELYTKYYNDYNALIGSNNAIVSENRKLRAQEETLNEEIKKLNKALEEAKQNGASEITEEFNKQKKVIVKMGEENKALKELVAKLKSMVKELL